MAIRKLRNGHYQAQYRPIPGGRQITRTNARKADVEAWLREQITATQTGTFVHPKERKTTFGEFYDEWSPRQICEANTREVMNLTARTVTFRDKPLGRIKRADIELWVNALTNQDRGTDPDGNPRPKGLAPMTIRTRMMHVRSVFRAAIADEKLARDPSVGVKLPATRKAAHAMQIPTPEQLTRILDQIPERQRALFATCAFAGLRLGEASALKVKDIDFLKRTIEVRRQVQKRTGGLEVRLPKYGSERVIAAAPGLLSILAAHIAGNDLRGEHGAWMFAADNQGPAAPSTIHYAWITARRRASSTTSRSTTSATSSPADSSRPDAT